MNDICGMATQLNLLANNLDPETNQLVAYMLYANQEITKKLKLVEYPHITY